jgi:hypothetical protein
MAKRWNEIVEDLRKSLGSPKKDEGKSEEKKAEDERKADEQGGREDNEDEEEVEDATPVLKALAEHIQQLETSHESMAKALASLAEQSGQTALLQKSIGESLLAVMERTEQIAGTPEPRRGTVSALSAAMAKGGGSAGAAPRHRQFTPADWNEVRETLCKAVADKRLTLHESAMAETQINKSIQNPAFQIDPKFLSILTNGK